MKRYTAQGFTLLEILVVVAIVALLIIPLYLSYGRTQANQGLKVSADRLANTFKQAHILAREAKEKSSWGVRSLDEFRYTVTSDNGKDGRKNNEEYTLEPSIQIVTQFDVMYAIGTGELKESENIILKNKYGNRMRIRLHRTGFVEYEEIK
jgi:prepilin-type N-terminal cleavage/methylation domain-containing protein